MSESRRSESVRTSPRITHDARGNAIWDWAVDTSVLASKTAADLIKTLDAQGGEPLALEIEAPVDNEHLGDPYNRPARVTGRRRTG